MARAVYFGLLLSLSSLCPAFQASITPRPAQHAAPETQSVLKSDSSLVVIPTHVTTDAGSSVTSLSRENFRLTEDDIEQPIVHFDKDDAPVSIGLLFDKSGSMVNKMDKAAEAVTAFFKTANTQDEFFLVEFSGGAKVSVPFTPDSGLLFERISHTKPSGMTSLLDAIDLSLAQMKKARHPRKAIVIISDGGDNWSRHSRREVRDKLVESDVQLYAMGIFDPDYLKKHEAETRNGPALLDELARETGGRNYTVSDVNDLPGISAKIGNDLRNEYLLGYYTAATRDGKYHKVNVNVSLNDQKLNDQKLTDQTRPLRTYFRKGYYAQ